MKKLLILISFSSLAFSANAATERTVTVSGECLRSVTADRASIIFTAEVVDKDPGKAGKQAVAVYETLRKDLKKLGLPDLELASSEYTVDQIREYKKDKYVPTGNFKARVGLKVTTSDTSQIGKAIADATKNQIQEVGNLNLFVSPEKMQKERDACLEEAAKNAQSKAEKLASSLNAHVGEIVTISEGAENRPPPRPVFMMARSAAAPGASDGNPTIEAGTSDLSLNITAVFALK